jgi:anti-anti-sigma factor
MEITQRRTERGVVLTIAGRLDAHWSEHLARELTRVITSGVHEVALDLTRVHYLSSAGIRVFLRYQKQLNRIQGSLAVIQASEAVHTVLTLAGLDMLLVTRTPHEPSPPHPVPTQGRHLAEVYSLPHGRALVCRAVGDPSLLLGARFQSEQCWAVTVPDQAFALGLGAFGDGFEDCRARFGEWLAVAGAAIYLPADGTHTPDYVVPRGQYRTESKLLYGLICEGPLSYLARFDAAGEGGSLSLTELLTDALDIAGTHLAGIVLVAETAGLVGAALRRAPTQAGSDEAPFRHPEIREWLTFTPERAFPQSVSLMTGVVARMDHTDLAPWLRPMGNSSLQGHVHAAAFSYHPVKKGRIELDETVTALLESQMPQGLLHLISDDRPITGAGESEFVRGACWIGPIGQTRIELEDA